MADIDVVQKKSSPWGWVVAAIALVVLMLWMAGVFSGNRGQAGESGGRTPGDGSAAPAATGAAPPR